MKPARGPEQPKSTASGWANTAIARLGTAKASATLYLHRARRCQHRVVQRVDLLADVLPRVMLGAIARSMREMRPQSMISQHLGDRLGQRLVVAGGHEETGLTVLDEGLQTSDARADDRRAAGHRLESDEAERLRERRDRAHIGRRVIKRERLLIERTDEVDVRLHAVLVH